jgi:inosine-uridine nucleoside N-ribohydrolase
MSRIAALCCVLGQLGCLTAAARAEEQPVRRVPIILDTDIGYDIDDALALGLALTSPELELRGVTTVHGDAYTRALIVCRLLDVLERGKVPVAAGSPPRPVPDFNGQMQYGLRPAHKRPVKESADQFLAAQLKAAPGELTIVCIGPLTNIAALLEKHPESAKQIKRLVIMGGSINVGYNGKPPAEPEWNIKSDVKAAQKVFATGVPITLVPLDVTATLAVDADGREKIFSSGTVLGHHLHALYQLWGKETPILFDPTAVVACIDESLMELESLRIAVSESGQTPTIGGRANAQVATRAQPEKLKKVVLERIVRPALAAADLPKALVLGIDARGRYVLQGNRLETAEFSRLLRDASSADAQPDSLVVSAHRDCPYQHVIRALDAATAAKIKHVTLRAASPPPAPAGKPALRGGFPRRVHVVENYETDIERRWWLAGKLETRNVPPGNRRACRAVLTNDFDDSQGDKYAVYKAVIFNPVPGPPMGGHTRLAFRYHLTGTDALRFQIYTLSKGYHRQLSVKGLEQGRWAEATVDLTQARRPDGTGGPLSEDERIDDIQFYADAAAELVIDDIVLYDAAAGDADDEGAGGVAQKKQPFPRQIVFTGWFDTGRQGAGAEWPGDFEIVPHRPPLTWKAAKAVAAPDGKSQWVRVDLRGPRPLPAAARLRFRYYVSAAKGAGEKDAGVASLGIELGAEGRERRATAELKDAKRATWAEADVDLAPAVGMLAAQRKTEGDGPAVAGGRGGTGLLARDIVFRVPAGAELVVDDVLLYEPGSANAAPKP